ncbi:hypothetical protein ACFQ07_29640 [Actinomadura adrarensis]|uniref:Secreted protein n=1 Tax=Actinomadura adrarensis TaxID=1819600 RepID=A0ABW3CPG5_9ACTN
MMKRLAAAGMLTAALGGVMLSATPAMANDDETEINQEKVLELNLLCNVGILAIQKDAECGGSDAVVSDDDEANEIEISKHHHHKKWHKKKHH